MRKTCVGRQEFARYHSKFGVRTHCTYTRLRIIYKHSVYEDPSDKEHTPGRQKYITIGEKIIEVISCYQEEEEKSTQRMKDKAMYMPPNYILEERNIYYNISTYNMLVLLSRLKFLVICVTELNKRRN